MPILGGEAKTGPEVSGDGVGRGAEVENCSAAGPAGHRDGRSPGFGGEEGPYERIGFLDECGRIGCMICMFV